MVVGRGVAVWRGVAGSAVAVGVGSRVAVVVAVGVSVDVAVAVGVGVDVDVAVGNEVEVDCGDAVAVATAISTAVGIGGVLLELAQAAKMIVPMPTSATIRKFKVSPISQRYLSERAYCTVSALARQPRATG
jgi:hypothetical protein